MICYLLLIVNKILHAHDFALVSLCNTMPTMFIMYALRSTVVLCLFCVCFYHLTAIRLRFYK